jgi:uncharacterized protein with NRDE domain
VCLLLLGVAAHPDYALVVAANRDEVYDRDAETAGFWSDAPQVLGGRDRLAGGTWLAVTTSGRFAAVTNVRDLTAPMPDNPPSRGFLTTEFVLGDDTPRRYTEAVSERGAAYAGFNLVVGTPAELWHCENNRAQAGPTRLAAGVHAISNASLDTPWPKARRGSSALTALLAQPCLDPEDLLALLADRSIAPDDALPDTGVGRETERRLSSVFVAPMPWDERVYGTRCSTALLIARDGRGLLVERSFAADGRPSGTRREAFQIRTDLSAGRAAS